MAASEFCSAQSSRPAWGGDAGGVEVDVGDGQASSVGRVVGGHLHAPERPHVGRDLHDVFDLKFFNEIAIAVVAADAHERTKAFVHPHIDGLVVAGCASGLVEADFVAGLAVDVFLALKDGIRPIEEAERKVFVGEVGSGDGIDQFFTREVDLTPIDHAEEFEFVVAKAHVEDVPIVAVFGVLELDVLAPEEKRDGSAFAAARERAFEWAVEFGERGGEPRALDDPDRVGGLGHCGRDCDEDCSSCGEKTSSHG